MGFWIFICAVIGFPLFYIVWLYCVPIKKRSADVLLIVGSNSPTILAERMGAALDLFQSKDFQIIVVSGGFGESGRMKKYLEERGINQSIIIEENQSKDTLQNIRFSKEIIIRFGFSSCVVVSSLFHLLRVKIIARHYSLNATFYYNRSPKRLIMEFIFFLKEVRYIYITSLITCGLIQNKND